MSQSDSDSQTKVDLDLLEPRGKVLCVGMACVDFINVVPEFPKEDSDQRGLDYYWQRGGNANNNCTVLSLMSIPCEFMGVLGTRGAEASWIKEDFESFAIDVSHCDIQDVLCPVATCMLSQNSGSRTILFYPRDRPELTYHEFHNQFNGDFSGYSWVHFELTSNLDDVFGMVADVVAYNNETDSPESQRSRVMISVEIEKPNWPNSEKLMGDADVVFISKEFAMSKGSNSMQEAVTQLHNLCKPGAVLVCAWGDQGASVNCSDVTMTSKALSDIKVIDSLGAGDTFVAGFIGHLWSNGFINMSVTDDGRQNIVAEALSFACHLAGLKCTMFGFRGLKKCMPVKIS